MSERKISSAPDYTNAAITMLGVNLMWIFFAIWVLYGFVPVLVLAVRMVGLDHATIERSWARGHAQRGQFHPDPFRPRQR